MQQFGEKEIPEWLMCLLGLGGAILILVGILFTYWLVNVR